MIRQASAGGILNPTSKKGKGAKSKGKAKAKAKAAPSK